MGCVGVGAGGGFGPPGGMTPFSFAVGSPIAALLLFSGFASFSDILPFRRGLQLVHHVLIKDIKDKSRCGPTWTCFKVKSLFWNPSKAARD